MAAGRSPRRSRPAASLFRSEIAAVESLWATCVRWPVAGLGRHRRGLVCWSTAILWPTRSYSILVELRRRFRRPPAKPAPLVGADQVIWASILQSSRVGGSTLEDTGMREVSSSIAAAAAGGPGPRSPSVPGPHPSPSRTTRRRPDSSARGAFHQANCASTFASDTISTGGNTPDIVARDESASLERAQVGSTDGASSGTTVCPMVSAVWFWASRGGERGPLARRTCNSPSSGSLRGFPASMNTSPPCQGLSQFGPSLGPGGG